jgi:hypothetical protein
MWRRVDLVRSDVSEESIVSIIRVQQISVLGTALAVTDPPGATSQRTAFFIRSCVLYAINACYMLMRGVGNSVVVRKELSLDADVRSNPECGKSYSQNSVSVLS